MIVVGKTYKFDAAHYLPGHPRCGKVHGHTYTLTIEVMGKPNEQGMVIDFHTLNPIVEKAFADIDHNVINLVLLNPTCELLAIFLADRIQSAIKRVASICVELRSLTIQEGQGGYARWQPSK